MENKRSWQKKSIPRQNFICAPMKFMTAPMKFTVAWQKIKTATVDFSIAWQKIKATWQTDKTSVMRHKPAAMLNGGGWRKLIQAWPPDRMARQIFHSARQPAGIGRQPGNVGVGDRKKG